MEKILNAIQKCVDYVISHKLQRILWAISAKLAYGIAQALIVVAFLHPGRYTMLTTAFIAISLLTYYTFVLLFVLKREDI